jgi:hypothetical protein
VSTRVHKSKTSSNTKKRSDNPKEGSGNLGVVADREAKARLAYRNSKARRVAENIARAAFPVVLPEEAIPTRSDDRSAADAELCVSLAHKALEERRALGVADVCLDAAEQWVGEIQNADERLRLHTEINTVRRAILGFKAVTARCV